MLRFKSVNLMDAAPTFSKSFELVFCRNVSLRFEAVKWIVSRLLTVLMPHGILVTGPTPGVDRSSEDPCMLTPHTYRRRGKK